MEKKEEGEEEERGKTGRAVGERGQIVGKLFRPAGGTKVYFMCFSTDDLRV